MEFCIPPARSAESKVLLTKPIVIAVTKFDVGPKFVIIKDSIAVLNNPRYTAIKLII